MRHRYISLIAGLMLASSCGGQDPQADLTIGFSSQSLVAGVQLVRVVFHTGRRCDVLRVAFKASGIYSKDIPLDAAAQMSGSSTDLDGIHAGTYTVAVFGAPSAMGPPTAFGCIEDQPIEDGKRAEIAVTLAALN